MIVVKKTYQELKQLAQEKGINLFVGNVDASGYQILAYYNSVVYDAKVIRNTSEYDDFIANDLSGIENRKNYQPEWDTIQITLPEDNEELHTYLNNGIIVQTVRTIYENSSKKQIIRVEKTIL